MNCRATLPLLLSKCIISAEGENVKRTTVWLTACVCLLSAPAFGAAIVGQIDTFQNSTTDNWFSGGLGMGQMPPTPPHVVSGGKGGPTDLYLVLTAIGGTGPGSKISVINTTQWTGNYLTSGISGIGLDLINLGNTTLDIRLQFEDPMFGPPADIAVSTNPFVLAPGSGWQHALFSTLPSAFTAAEGSVTAALSNTTALRIIHSTVADEATSIVGVLGVDNIQAVPEPGTFLLFSAGLAALLWRLVGARPQSIRN
jgi:PEP-CTERM motif